MRCLVTGGAGFMGSHVAEDLIKRGHEVWVLDDLSGGFKRNLVPGIKFVKGDVNDVKLIKRLFKKKFDYVFHLAAYAAECHSHFIKRFNYMNNLVGAVNLINESVNSKVKCFVFTSSAAVYGQDKVPNPEDSYGIAKLAVEQELKITKQMFGLNYIIFRPHNVYGERQNLGDKYRNVLGIFMNQILQGLPMTVYGDGEQKRAFTYIKDVSPIIASCTENPNAYNQIFDIGADQLYSINKLATQVAVSMGVVPKIKHIPARKEVRVVSPSHLKIQRVFGYKIKYSLKDGINEMSNWAKKIGKQKETKPKWRREIWQP